MTQLDAAKRLTEFLGECWHENPGIPINSFAPDVFTCVKCGEYFNRLNKNRTFFLPDDWDDLGAVRNELVETGKWEAFILYAIDIYHYAVRDEDDVSDFIEGLIYPPTFNRLADEFLEGERA